MAGDAHTQTEAIELIHSVIGYAEQRAGAPSQAHAALDALVARLDQLTEALERAICREVLTGSEYGDHQAVLDDYREVLAAAGSSANPEESEAAKTKEFYDWYQSEGRDSLA